MSEESDFISSPGATFSYLGQALRELLDADDFSDVWKDVLSWYVSQEDWKDKVNITIRGLFHNNQEYYLKKKLSGNYTKIKYIPVFPDLKSLLPVLLVILCSMV